MSQTPTFSCSGRMVSETDPHRRRRCRGAAPVALAAALSFLTGPPAGAEDPARGHAGRHGFADAEHWARIFDDPSRHQWQRPRLVMQLLGIGPGDHVADIGAGTGYFTRQLAMAVGSRGRVYAVEIESSLLDHIQAREDMATLREQLVTILAEPDDPQLPDGEIDVVLVVNTWHHISGRERYIERLRRALRPDGRVVIIDWRAGDIPMGPPPEERLPRETVIAEFERAGWLFDTESVMLPYQYFFVFEPPPAN